MNVFYGFLIAFSMYSAIPVPIVEWTKERMGYALCWFPAVGAVCGGGVWLWFWLAVHLEIHPAAAGLIGAAVPMLITGGIHLDGFLDTVDARRSYAGREKKLEILSDPHTGAFAIIGLGLYLLLYAGALIQLFVNGSESGQWGRMTAFCLVFPLERALSGLAVVSFPCAKESGLAKSFSDGAQKTVTRIVMGVWIAGTCAGTLCIGLWEFAAVCGVGCLVFGYYRRMAVNEFGGITGDLAGWFLQVAELAVLLVLAGSSCLKVS